MKTDRLQPGTIFMRRGLRGAQWGNWYGEGAAALLHRLGALGRLKRKMMEGSREKKVVRCKNYHRPLKKDDPGQLRARGDVKSRCPAWADDERLRTLLLAEAIVDPDGGEDSHGRPRRLWNAVNDCYFIGVSTNEAEAAYNCYPETPATRLHRELAERARRSVEDIFDCP
jgi:hypothetical protein